MLAGGRVRRPLLAGHFYPAGREACLATARSFCRAAESSPLGVLIGAIAPHAGWSCSGRVAGLALGTLARHSDATIFVITGSMHHDHAEGPVCDAADAWETPLGPVPVEAGLRDAMAALDGFDRDARVHEHEHSLEVQVPLLQVAVGAALHIVPCLVPPRPLAPAWGRRLGGLLREWPEPVAIVASTDLTHYGPSYGFTPHGRGAEGRRWARDTNDRELLACVERLDAAAALQHAVSRHSACGGGAVAMTIEACRATGAESAVVLEHTDSSRVLGDPDALDAVGYAAVVLG